MKKYHSDGKRINMKKVVIASLVVVLVLIFIITLIHTIRNYKIIKDLQEKNKEYSSKTNYHIIIKEKLTSDVNINTDYYFKDDKIHTNMETTNKNEISKMSIYSTEEQGKNNIYMESTINPEKTAKLNSSESTYVMFLYNGLETITKKDIFIESLLANIKSEECNGKKCYKVKNIVTPYHVIQDGEEDYIEKETGLTIRKVTKDYTQELQYEFDTVTDEDFEEPDISEYTIEE